MNSSSNNIKHIINNIEELKLVLHKNYNYNVNELILKKYELNYDKPSMASVLNKKEGRRSSEQAEGEKYLDSFNLEKVSRLESVMKHIKGRETGRGR